MPMLHHPRKDQFCFEKSCKFIGSLAVSLLKGEERQAFVNEKLLEMKDVGKGIPVVISVSDEGIKILNDQKSAVKMAHGITRVRFSTCHPDRRLFAYVVKAPGLNGKMVTQAHMFKTSKVKHTHELSSSISRAFKIAYSKNTAKRKNKVDMFEKNAEDEREVINVQKKRWARNELAHGHDDLAHALRAKGQGSVVASPSSGVQKLVDRMDKEAELQQVISQEERVVEQRVSITPRKKFSDPVPQRVTSPDFSVGEDSASITPRKKLSDPGKILPQSGEPFSQKRKVSATRNRRFSKDQLPVTPPSEGSSGEGEIESNFTPISSGLGTVISDIPPSVGNFISPTPRFSSYQENDFENPASPTSVEPIDKFEPLPDIPISENSKHEYINFPANDSMPHNNLELRENPTYPENFVKAVTRFGNFPQSEDELKKEKEIVIDYVNLPALNKNGSSKKQHSNKKLKDIPDTFRMTMTDDQILKDSEWFQPGFSRNIAEEILQNRPVGAFFIRDSSSHPGSYVLTMKVPTDVKSTGVMNYLIIKDCDGLHHLKGYSSYFPGLTYLVAHYSSILEDIPCRLHLSSDNPLLRMEQECGYDQTDADELDNLFDGDLECDDDDYINFSSNADICRELDELSSSADIYRELDELCFGED